MSRLHPRPLTLVLGIVLIGSIAHAAPPREPGDDPGRSPGLRTDNQVSRIYSSPRTPREPAYATDYIVVQFAPRVSAAMRGQISKSLGGREYVPAQFGDFGRVFVAPGEDTRALVRRFRANRDVERAALDPIVWPHVRGVDMSSRSSSTMATRPNAAAGQAAAARAVPGTGPKPSRAVAERGTSPAQTTPAQTDPFLGLQWHHSRIRLQEAERLNATRGAGVVVAVIDTGVLFGSGGSCENNFPRGRGFDLAGVSFVPGIDLVNRGTQPLDEGNAENQRFFLFGHGTYVAAQIAAAVDNDQGGRGVAPRVSIMPIRVFPRFGGAPFSRIAEAINFAVDNGADVINMSLGGPEGTGVERQAIQRAHAAGIVLVASSGNEADEPDAPSDVSFPARYPEVIAVGATDFFDQRSSYSNFGPGIALTAPGGDFSRNPDPVGNVGSNSIFDGTLAPSFQQHPVTGAVQCAHFWANGTSFSAPQVSAAAALLKAIGVQDPDTIRTLLQNGARDIGAAGFDNQTGHGLLDLFSAHAGFGFSFE